MRYFEIRRHSMRAQPGQHLTQAGVTLARRVGNEMGPFDRVLTSDRPRAYETAIAMGFAVDAQDEKLSAVPESANAEMIWDKGFAGVAQAIHQSGEAAAFANAQAELWRTILAELPDGGRVLVISHGGIIEAGAIACLPKADYAAWGAPCSYCEGVRLILDGGQFTNIEFLRVAAG